MTDYISRKSFIERVKDIPFWGSVAVLIAEQLPAADVREVVLGHWIDTDNYYQRWKCSVCGCHTRDARPPYCSNCGADMREES